MKNKDYLPGGIADKKRVKDFDPKQLAIGQKHEMEHTKDPKIAREIASDHLAEDPRYYIKLKQVEKYFNEAVSLMKEWKSSDDVKSALNSIISKVSNLSKNDPIHHVVDIHGILINIEWPRGSVRKYSDGYERQMQYDYGYLHQGTNETTDGEELDCYIGPHIDSKRAFIVSQLEPKTGKFDEEKIMLGFDSEAHAKMAYTSQMTPEHFGGIREVTFEELKRYIDKKPIASADVKKPEGEKYIVKPNQDIKKTRGHINFPNLGISGRHETPMEVPARRAKHFKAIMSRIGGGAVTEGQKGRTTGKAKLIGEAKTPILASHVYNEPQKSKTPVTHGTSLHEKQHMAFQQVASKYGNMARQSLARHLLNAVPKEHHDTIRNIASATGATKAGAHSHEEVIAHLHNYLNDPVRRKHVDTQIETKILGGKHPGATPTIIASRQQRFKRAAQAFRAMREAGKKVKTSDL